MEVKHIWAKFTIPDMKFELNAISLHEHSYSKKSALNEKAWLLMPASPAFIRLLLPKLQPSGQVGQPVLFALQGSDLLAHPALRMHQVGGTFHGKG